MSAIFNLDFYSGTDYYSDGDIEDEILKNENTFYC